MLICLNENIDEVLGKRIYYCENLVCVSYSAMNYRFCPNGNAVDMVWENEKYSVVAIRSLNFYTCLKSYVNKNADTNFGLLLMNVIDLGYDNQYAQMICRNMTRNL